MLRPSRAGPTQDLQQLPLPSMTTLQTPVPSRRGIRTERSPRSKASTSSHSPVIHTTVRSKLDELGIPPRLAGAALRVIPREASGLLIYGSRARADHVHESDLDLLALVPQPKEMKALSDVSLSCYTSDQLSGASGTLFGMHLKRDGIVVFDSVGELEALIDSFQQPDPEVLLARVRHFSAILNVADLGDHLPGVCRLARYLLRTAIYSLALADGRPCFSVRELAERFAEPRLATLLSSHSSITGPPSFDEFAELRSRLRTVVGIPPPIAHPSLESLAVAEWDDDRQLSTLAIMAMSSKKSALQYAALPKVLL